MVHSGGWLVCPMKSSHSRCVWKHSVSDFPHRILVFDVTLKVSISLLPTMRYHSISSSSKALAFYRKSTVILLVTRKHQKTTQAAAVYPRHTQDDLTQSRLKHYHQIFHNHLQNGNDFRFTKPLVCRYVHFISYLTKTVNLITALYLALFFGSLSKTMFLVTRKKNASAITINQQP